MNMKERNKRVLKVVVASVVLIVVVAVCLGIKVSDYQDRQVSLDYQETFMELEVIPRALIDAEAGVLANEISREQYNKLEHSSESLANVYVKEKIPIEEIKEFNDNVRRIFGANSRYEINPKYQRDYEGFMEGLAYWKLDFTICWGWKNQLISDENFNEYEIKSQEFLENFSREKVNEMYDYMSKILIKSMPMPSL